MSCDTWSVFDDVLPCTFLCLPPCVFQKHTHLCSMIWHIPFMSMFDISPFWSGFDIHIMYRDTYLWYTCSIWERVIPFALKKHIYVLFLALHEHTSRPTSHPHFCISFCSSFFSLFFIKWMVPRPRFPGCKRWPCWPLYWPLLLFLLLLALFIIQMPARSI